jgi:AcrR family transcriptional regulator
VPVTSPVSERSLTSDVRRRQIVAATIEVIAEEGFRGATFARIASQAGLSSTRLISYHFTDKAELVGAVVLQVVSAIGGAVSRRVWSETTARGQLRGYIEGVVEFTAEHRADMRALLRIVLAGALPSGTGADVAVPSHLVEMLRNGQVSGEFRDFDVAAMALVVQRAVEALPFALEADPDLDCPAFGRELVTLFDLATRRQP